MAQLVLGQIKRKSDSAFDAEPVLTPFPMPLAATDTNR